MNEWMNDWIWINGGMILTAVNQVARTKSYSSATGTLPFEFVSTDVVYQNRTTKYDSRNKYATLVISYGNAKNGKTNRNTSVTFEVVVAVSIKMKNEVWLSEQHSCDKLHGVTSHKMEVFSVFATKGFARSDTRLLTFINCTPTNSICFLFLFRFSSCWHASCNLRPLSGILRSVSHPWILKLTGFCDPENGSAKGLSNNIEIFIFVMQPWEQCLQKS